MSERIERTERLLNLVIALMASESAVPRADIHRNIPGYSQTASAAAFERMFERDKDELRSMGIPVETVVDVNGEVRGYRIPQDRYALAELDLTVPERAAIAVAAQVWGQAAVGPVAGTALLKLESLDDSEWAPAGLRGTVQLTAADGALLPLMSAVRQHRAVTFPYRTPADDTPATRTVTPWGLRSTRGTWFLVAHDHDRDAPRTFRLSRITGTVTPAPGTEPVRPPEGFDVGSHPIGPGGDEPVTVRLRALPGRAASLRRLAVVDDDVDPWTVEEFTVAVGSLDQLTSLACAAGPDVVVLDPPEAVAAVRSALAAIVAAHSPGTGEAR
jgi:predicted DNA-binding transcriptional regulator YafY